MVKDVLGFVVGGDAVEEEGEGMMQIPPI